MAKRFENPLLSDARLKEMYAAMVETRALSERLRRTRGMRMKGFVSGTEACWIGSAIGLRDSEGNFAAADEGVAPTLTVVLGTTSRASLRGERAKAALPLVGLTPLERAWFALGAASRMTDTKTAGLVFMGTTQLSAPEWKQVFSKAVQLQLPLVFITVPVKGDDAGIAELSSKLGVPGIPVDASDAVAIYRVAQESMGRARAGGGPALIEAVRFPGSKDPIALLKRQLVAKRVVTESWAETTEQRLRARIASLRD